MISRLVIQLDIFQVVHELGEGTIVERKLPLGGRQVPRNQVPVRQQRCSPLFKEQTGNIHFIRGGMRILEAQALHLGAVN